MSSIDHKTMDVDEENLRKDRNVAVAGNCFVKKLGKKKNLFNQARDVATD